ncbi:MAG: hypothetical protein ACT4P7_17195 [Gemmatimonadaceae bacterium]
MFLRGYCPLLPLARLAGWRPLLPLARLAGWRRLLPLARLAGCRLLIPLTLLAGCRAGESASPLALNVMDFPSQAAVYPAASYVPGSLPDPGEFTDVNEKNLMVGNILLPGGLHTSAFILALGNPLFMLPNGKGAWSLAAALNTSAAITGTVFMNSVDYHPAVWPTPRTTPRLLTSVTGTASDINDAGLVVGTEIRNGVTHAFLWEPSGALTYLPPLAGGTATYAIAINNNDVILGSSSSSSGWFPVLWRWSGSAWRAHAITGGINALALDDRRMVVGQTANEASWGIPDHRGYFGVGVYSHATGVARDGSAAIGESSYPVTGPATRNAWVADRSGNVTFLPIPNSL